MTIELPDGIIDGNPLTIEQSRIKLACALYESGKVSTKQAWEITGVPTIQFWEGLGKRKVPRQCGPKNLAHDVRVLDELAAKKRAA